ncbi:MAG: GGDEF domain-containing protein [Chloroflexota bacterium]
MVLTKFEDWSIKHRAWIAIGSLILVMIIAYLDTVTGLYLELTIFYLIPIFLTTWYMQPKAGAFLAGLVSVTWLISDFYAGAGVFGWGPVYWNGIIRFCFFLVVVFLLARIKSDNIQLSNLARTDPLTGLSNRRAFYEAATQEIEICRRSGNVFSLAYMDVDNFKNVNDRLGHHAGDDLLRLIAATLSHHIRSVDVVARLGGDEFVVLLPNTDSKVAHTAVMKLWDSLNESVMEKNFPVTFSIGVMSFVRPPQSLDTMLEKVDELMYSVKKEGKNKVVFEG